MGLVTGDAPPPLLPSLFPTPWLLDHTPALCRWELSVIAATDAVAKAFFAESAPAFVER